MGRVVKGAHVTQQAYQIKPPSLNGNRLSSPASHDDDPFFAQMHAVQPAASNAPAGVDMDAVRAEAAQLIDDASADAQRLLEDARERATALIDDAEHRAAGIEAAAKSAGFEQGVHDGRAAASQASLPKSILSSSVTAATILFQSMTLSCLAPQAPTDS